MRRILAKDEFVLEFFATWVQYMQLQKARDRARNVQETETTMKGNRIENPDK